MAIKVTGTTVINDSRNIENITTINGTAWATVVSNASAGAEVTEAEVTAHEAALTITESQISDLGTYETADATILKDADIGVNVEAFDATILKDADIGVNVEAFDATILKDADIGVNVQAYNANYVVDATYVKTDENFTTADHTKLDGIEALADVTDTTNVTAAGALMDSEVTNLADVKAFDTTDYATAAQGATADSALQSVAFGDLTTTPTTISGYGITDASTTTEMNAAISTAVGNLIDSAPTALDTLNELAASLGDDADFAGTMTTNLATKLPLAGGALTGAVTTTSTFDGRDVATDGTKLDTIATNADVTPSWVPASDPSYISGYTVTSGDVTAHEGDLTITESQISDLGSYLTSVPAQSFSSLTGKPTTISGYGITDAFDGAYSSLSGQPTIPTNNNQLSNGAGYITSFTNTTYSAGSGLDLSGTTFSLESDARGDLFYMGRDTNDYIGVETTQINFVLDGNTDMRLENDGDLHVDGNVVAYSTTTSDERLKKDIVKIDNALDKVGQLNGYTFEYLNDGKKSAGILAQEVEAVMPSAVSEMKLPLKSDDDQEYKVVQYDQLHGLLIEAIKELKAEIEVLKGN